MEIKFIKFTFAALFVAFLFFPGVAKGAVVGERMSFFVDNSYDVNGRATLGATLQEISAHAYFYTEDDWFNGLTSQNGAKSSIHVLASEFDQRIYPTLTQIYGSLWEPGVDNDPKITILISKIKEGAGGYFNSADEYPKSQVQNSNAREMVYLNGMYIDLPRARSFLAHEFQHLITFYQKDKLHGISDDTWLNEARSEYASTLCGYDNIFSGSNLEKRIFDFFKNPSDSLTEWDNVPADYGTGNLFLQYLVGHFGQQILGKMVQSSATGISSISEALQSLGFKETFNSVFLNWTIANYLNDCRIDGQKYCYLRAELVDKIKVPATVYQIFPNSATSSLASWTDSIKDWSGHWYKFSGGNANLEINFKGAKDGNFTVAYILQKFDGSSEVKFIDLDANGQGTGFVNGFGSDYRIAIIIPVSEAKISGFSASEPTRNFSFEAVITSQSDPALSNPPPPSVPVPIFSDGSLIRARGDYKVYVVNNGYKRWIQSSEIFKFYPHLGWASVSEVAPEDLAKYKEAWLVRADGDTKVYEINGDATKHWLNMTAQQFSQSGRKWDMVFIINKSERDFYRTGVAVLR